MFSERLIEHFRNPQNVGELAPPAITIEVSNPACGDVMRLSARVACDRVAEARYQTRGCTASIAVGSAVTEWMVGRTLRELESLDAAAVEDLVGGLPNESRHAAVLSIDAARALVREIDAR